MAPKHGQVIPRTRECSYGKRNFAGVMKLRLLRKGSARGGGVEEGHKVMTSTGDTGGSKQKKALC